MKVNETRLFKIEKELGLQRERELERVPDLSPEDELVVQSIVNGYESNLRTLVIRNESPEQQKAVEALGQRFERKLQEVYRKY